MRFLIVAFCVAATLFNWINPISAQKNARAQDKSSEKEIYQRLEGKWIRPDGGYILELKSVGANGVVKARYYNPKPISVGISNWSADEGYLMVFVELRDNYQGSTYTLQYDPGSDVLRGKYFQAPTGRTYEVEFLRGK